MYIDPKYEIIKNAFRELLNVEDPKQLFGQAGKPVFGISDRKKGVQWNLGIWPDTDIIRVGVNLEGTEKTGGWLISNFILSELKNPTIELLKNKFNDKLLKDIAVRFSRDAWQGPGRLNIVEQYFGGEEFIPLPDINKESWLLILDEAKSCLNKKKYYKGRVKQIVTLKSTGKKLEKEVSPHLSIHFEIFNNGSAKINNENAKINNENAKIGIQEGLKVLEPAYNWVNDIVLKDI